MLIVDVHEMRSEETSSNIQADSQATYSPTTKYVYGDEVVYGDYVWYSINRDNTGNQPDISPLYWVIMRLVNNLRLYDKFPNSLSVNSGDDIVLKYNVTNVNAIYIGNAHGDQITVQAGGTYTKSIPVRSHSAIDAWGAKAYDQMGDLYVELPSLYSGTITVTIKKSSKDNESALGFINYGDLKNVGCTLVDTVKYNIRGGTGVDWQNLDLSVFKANSYQEIKLPIRIDEDTITTPEVIDTLSDYRGLPVLIIGDDTGKREELLFFGIYTDIEADIKQKNSYNIVLRSLSYKAFVAPTDIEKSLHDSERAVAEYMENNPP